MAKEKGGYLSYRGTPGHCPDCHGIPLEIRPDGIYCPQCLTKAKVSMVSEELTVDMIKERLPKYNMYERAVALPEVTKE